MENASNTPSLRFRGYTDAWGQETFGDILTVYPFKPYIAKPKLSGEYPVIQQGDNPILGYADGEPFRDYKNVVLFGDHTVSLYKPESPFFLATDGIKTLGSKTKFEGNFLYSLLEKYKPESEGYKRHFSMLKEQECWFPNSVEEQHKIGCVFNELDSLLSLHQRKLEKLQEIKKSLLQNMFPAEGEDRPKIRFGGYTDAWGQERLGNVLEICSETNADNKYGKNDVLSVSDEFGVVNQIELQGRSFAAEDVSRYKKVRTGQIVYTRSPLASKPYGIIKIVEKYEGILSPLYIVNSPKHGIDSRFVYYYFDLTERTNNYLKPLVRMGAKHTMNISNEEWLSGNIMFPRYSEQKKISDCLAQLDSLLSLHQRSSCLGNNILGGNEK